MYWGQCQSLCFNFFYRWLLDVTILMILSCTISSLWEVQKRCYINTRLKWSSHALMYCKSLKCRWRFCNSTTPLMLKSCRLIITIAIPQCNLGLPRAPHVVYVSRESSSEGIRSATDPGTSCHGCDQQNERNEPESGDVHVGEHDGTASHRTKSHNDFTGQLPLFACSLYW